MVCLSSQVKSRFTLFGGKKAICRGGGSRAQELVRAGVVPTTPRSLERVWREMSHFRLCCANQAFFCLKFVGFSCSFVLHFQFHGSRVNAASKGNFRWVPGRSLSDGPIAGNEAGEKKLATCQATFVISESARRSCWS